MARDKKDIVVVTKASKKVGTGIRKKIKHRIWAFVAPAVVVACIAVVIGTEKPKWEAKDEVPATILVVDESEQEYVKDSEATKIESPTVEGKKDSEEEIVEEDPNRNYDTTNPDQKPPVI